MPKYVSDDPEARARQRANLKTIARLPDDYRWTKPMRFTLPVELADKLENMPKKKRDELLTKALE